MYGTAPVTVMENIMKQKFTFIMDEEKNTVILQEAAETDPGSFLTVHEETYPLDEITAAAGKGVDAFVEMARRKNMFPPRDLMERLFETFSDALEQGAQGPVVMDYEDIDAFPDEEEEIPDGDDADVDELEELLKDDDEDDLSEDDIKEIDGDDDTPRFQTDDDSEHEN